MLPESLPTSVGSGPSCWATSITQFALLDEGALTWTVYPGTGKFDDNSEEGWTLLPGGDVLTVDTYIGVPYNSTGK